jgi:hypothetical protein
MILSIRQTLLCVHDNFLTGAPDNPPHAPEGVADTGSRHVIQPKEPISGHTAPILIGHVPSTPRYQHGESITGEETSP